MPKASQSNRLPPHGTPVVSYPAPFGEGAVKDIAEHYNMLADYLAGCYPAKLAPLALTLGLWRTDIEANFFPPAVTPNGWDKEQIDTQAKASMLCHILRGRKDAPSTVVAKLASLSPLVQLAYLIGYDLVEYEMPQRLALAFERTYSHNLERFERLQNWLTVTPKSK